MTSHGRRDVSQPVTASPRDDDLGIARDLDSIKTKDSYDHFLCVHNWQPAF
jgi:hypothetical protein